VPNLYVGGRWASARVGGVRDVVNPWDQSVVAKVDEAGPEDVAEAIAAARRAFDAGPWPQTPAMERGVLLGKIAALLERDREEIARIETLDTGKTLRESRIDVDDVVSVFRYYAGLADKDAGRVIATPSPDV
jgi:betaine-aldehyde dehydrogenase